MVTEHVPQHSRGARLLLAEQAVIMPILRQTPREDFDRPTICTGWSVRDVLSHCAAALTRAASGTLHRFTPQDNELDVEERRSWPVAQILEELEGSYAAAAEAITAAGGALDIMALGEWVHGGDIRDALGVPGAYASEGVEDVLALLARFSRRRVPSTDVYLHDRDLHLSLGPEPPTEPVVRMTADVETLIRLCTGRHPDPSRLKLDGADQSSYVLLA